MGLDLGQHLPHLRVTAQLVQLLKPTQQAGQAGYCVNWSLILDSVFSHFIRNGVWPFGLGIFVRNRPNLGTFN